MVSNQHNVLYKSMPGQVCHFEVSDPKVKTEVKDLYDENRTDGYPNRMI
jgi:hypothetical protein